jgi:hypothetical protein
MFPLAAVVAATQATVQVRSRPVAPQASGDTFPVPLQNFGGSAGTKELSQYVPGYTTSMRFVLLGTLGSGLTFNGDTCQLTFDGVGSPISSDLTLHLIVDTEG